VRGGAAFRFSLREKLARAARLMRENRRRQWFSLIRHASHATFSQGRRKEAAFVLVLLLTPAQAVQPDEILKDPALEARARQLSAGLRCLVCQNESIDDSNAPLARDLRLLVRERIVAGETDAQVKAFLVARYGEFVLLRPPVSARTAVLYGAPFVALTLGGLLVWRLSRRRTVVAAAGLSEDEKRRLERVLERK
jgi:cytochrome c-type biogenesis protein CcmH